MEAAVAATSSSSLLLLFSSPSRRLLLPPSSSLLGPPRQSCCNRSSSSSSAANQRRLICLAVPPLLHSKRSSSLRCSASSAAAGGPSSAAASSERWVLEPAGDGDWRHIGYKVARPGAFEIASDAVTVGRVADKADIVLPVATVSGTHARLEKKDGSLVVTDLDSTNGTYINERRLVPGFPVPIDPGNLLIFGDIHLAMFRVRKMIVRETQAQEQEAAEVVASTAAASEDAGSTS